MGNNGIGVVDVNWDVSIIGSKFLNVHGSGSLSDAMECFNYFNHLKHVQGVNIQVTNNSWGDGSYSQAMSDAMEGLDQPGMSLILHATAAGKGDFFGNPINNDVTPHYPSSYALDNNIAVAATDRNDLYASFSNYGAISVGPGRSRGGVLSTVLDNTYDTYSRTSMATPTWLAPSL